jgi:small GTP-binding protein
MDDNENDAQTPIPCKVVLIGESGVGKTSIIARYLTNTFSTAMNSTAGANFTTKTVFLEDEKKTIKFEIWDTAGQEKYRSLNKVFYQKASVCILVYEITKKATFEELKKYWIQEIKNNSVNNISKINFLIY